MTPYQNLVVYLWEDAVALVSFGEGRGFRASCVARVICQIHRGLASRRAWLDLEQMAARVICQVEIFEVA